MYNVRNRDPDAVVASSLKLYDYRVEMARKRQDEDELVARERQKLKDREARKAERARRKEEKKK